MTLKTVHINSALIHIILDSINVLEDPLEIVKEMN